MQLAASDVLEEAAKIDREVKNILKKLGV